MLSSAEISDFTRQALDLVLVNSMPTMLAAGITGLVVALLQALTQVQDQGFPTAVKFFAVMGTLYATTSSLAAAMLAYGDVLFNRIANL
jgi:type III secretion protein S